MTWRPLNGSSMGIQRLLNATLSSSPSPLLASHRSFRIFFFRRFSSPQQDLIVRFRHLQFLQIFEVLAVGTFIVSLSIMEPNYYTNLMTSQNPPYPNSSNPSPLQNPNMQSTPEEIPTQKRSKSKKTFWNKEEEMLLARAWLHISEDSIIGTSQREREFWQRINTYYQDNSTSGVTRNQANLKAYWHYMNPLVVVFNQMYSVLKSQHLSGWSDDDLNKGAHQQYRARYAAEFRHEHIWNLVKHEPKWQPASTASGASRCSSNAQAPINLDDDEVAIRPIGTKAAKKKAKGKATNSSSSSNSRFDEIFEKHVEDNKKAFEKYQNSLDVKNKLKEQQLKNEEIAILFMDPRTMSDFGQEVWRNRCEEIRVKYNM